MIGLIRDPLCDGDRGARHGFFVHGGDIIGVGDMNISMLGLAWSPTGVQLLLDGERTLLYVGVDDLLLSLLEGPSSVQSPAHTAYTAWHLQLASCAYL